MLPKGSREAFVDMLAEGDAKGVLRVLKNASDQGRLGELLAVWTLPKLPSAWKLTRVTQHSAVTDRLALFAYLCQQVGPELRAFVLRALAADKDCIEPRRPTRTKAPVTTGPELAKKLLDAARADGTLATLVVELGRGALPMRGDRTARVVLERAVGAAALVAETVTPSTVAATSASGFVEVRRAPNLPAPVASIVLSTSASKRVQAAAPPPRSSPAATRAPARGSKASRPSQVETMWIDPPGLAGTPLGAAAREALRGQLQALLRKFAADPTPENRSAVVMVARANILDTPGEAERNLGQVFDQLMFELDCAPRPSVTGVGRALGRCVAPRPLARMLASSVETLAALVEDAHETHFGPLASDIDTGLSQGELRRLLEAILQGLEEVASGDA